MRKRNEDRYEVMTGDDIHRFDLSKQVEILDEDAQIDRMNEIMSLALSKAHKLVSDNSEFIKGEITAIEKLAQTLVKLRENSRKEEEHRSKHESDMTRKELIKVLAEQMSLLNTAERKEVEDELKYLEVGHEDN